MKNIRTIQTQLSWKEQIIGQLLSDFNVSDFLIEVARKEIEGKITMDEAQAMIDEHSTQMDSNCSSYVIVLPNQIARCWVLSSKLLTLASEA